MKPMPASATQRPTCSGVMSILTPSEDSTSAAPERDDSARLPCLATGTPAPATMKRGAGRHVDRAGAVAAGADHVDGVGGSVDAQHLGAHRRYRAGDLVDGFAAHPQRHQQSAHLRGRRFAGHHAVEGGCGLVARQRGAGRDFADDRFEVVHRLLSDCGPVRTIVCSCSRRSPARTAAWLIVVPISVSSFATYCATCSSVMARSSCSFSFLISSEAKSTGGTVDVGHPEYDPFGASRAGGLSHAIFWQAKSGRDCA